MTTLNFSDVDTAPALADRISAVIADLREEYRASHEFPWIVGFSGGKDSTLVVQLVFEMLLEIAPGDRTRWIHIVANDTLVESPLVIRHLTKMLERLAAAAEALRLPITVMKTKPDTEQSFWVNLIGRGYPSPSRTFRWCTDRLKIQPTSQYIRTQATLNGKAILLLGVRREESSSRAVSVNRYENGQRLNPHNDLPGCLVYRPIVDLSTDEVWEVLLQRRPPWGGSHRELVTLYRNAQGGECPLVIDQSQAPSCGTASSRFGCWTCTVVVKDRSMEGFIDAGHAALEPLLEFRDWLAEIRNDETMRMAYRRNGVLTYLKNGKLVPGPFTLAARRQILDRLVAMQTELGDVLITDEEIATIHRIWASDAAKPNDAAAVPQFDAEEN
jgi:DNA sulfur modification protein DndC